MLQGGAGVPRKSSQGPPMANADIYLKTDEFLHSVLIDAEAAATDDGAWVDLGPYRTDVSIHVTGITTATVTINGSSAQTIPADSANGVAIGAAITADTILTLTAPPRWIKARVTA